MLMKTFKILFAAIALIVMHSFDAKAQITPGPESYSYEAGYNHIMWSVQNSGLTFGSGFPSSTLLFVDQNGNVLYSYYVGSTYDGAAIAAFQQWCFGNADEMRELYAETGNPYYSGASAAWMETQTFIRATGPGGEENTW